MKNPWTAKNPFMSAWLSGANKAAGIARGQATAVVKRETAKATKSATAAGTQQVAEFWSAAFGLPAKAKPAKKR